MDIGLRSLNEGKTGSSDLGKVDIKISVSNAIYRTASGNLLQAEGCVVTMNTTGYNGVAC